MIIACIFLMTTTIKGRGHDVARALSGFVCFPVPPIHPSTRYLFFCYSHFMHREYCVGKHCRAELRKSKIFSQSKSTKFYIKEGLDVQKLNSTSQLFHLSKPKFCDMLQCMFYSLSYGAQTPLWCNMHRGGKMLELVCFCVNSFFCEMHIFIDF